MICPRCKNQDAKYFYTFNNTSYCRKCIHVGFTNSTPIKEVNKENLNANYKLNYQLTPLQKELSEKLLWRYRHNQNTILKAICGAGKTEITYALIKHALNNGHNVCFTTPRKELVIELAKRFSSQFTDCKITCVYGGNTQKTDGQFIICTTHQLYRYPNFFDLLILDEYDAFPYANNDILKAFVENSIRGNYVYMSATLLMKPDLQMTKRYHGHLLDIPKCHISSILVMYILTIIKVHKFKQAHKPVLIFVPTIKLTSVAYRYFHLAKLRVKTVSSKTPNIHDLIEQLQLGKLDALITTTILERGITIDNVQVIILYGNNQIYDSATLIQICGRVGRKINHPTGSINIYTPYKTKAIKECIATIEKDNA